MLYWHISDQWRRAEGVGLGRDEGGGAGVGRSYVTQRREEEGGAELVVLWSGRRCKLKTQKLCTHQGYFSR